MFSGIKDAFVEAIGNKLSNRQVKALRLLNNRPNGMMGLDMVIASCGVINRGTIYNVLSSLEEKRYIRSRHANWEMDVRRSYTITEAGKQALVDFDRKSKKYD